MNVQQTTRVCNSERRAGCTPSLPQAGESRNCRCGGGHASTPTGARGWALPLDGSVSITKWVMAAGLLTGSAGPGMHFVVQQGTQWMLGRLGKTGIGDAKEITANSCLWWGFPCGARPHKEVAPASRATQQAACTTPGTASAWRGAGLKRFPNRLHFAQQRCGQAAWRANWGAHAASVAWTLPRPL